MAEGREAQRVLQLVRVTMDVGLLGLISWAARSVIIGLLGSAPAAHFCASSALSHSLAQGGPGRGMCKNSTFANLRRSLSWSHPVGCCKM